MISPNVRLELTGGTRVDVEMQIRADKALPARIVYYAARDYADQLRRGDELTELTPTVVVVWLVATLFAEPPQFHHVFELRERSTHARLSDQLSIHPLPRALPANAPTRSNSTKWQSHKPPETRAPKGSRAASGEVSSKVNAEPFAPCSPPGG
jgi:hypothetical protein